MRERSKAELWECIIAKAEEGYNEQRRLKPEVKAERIQNFGGLGFFFGSCFVAVVGFCSHANIYRYAI